MRYQVTGTFTIEYTTEIEADTEERALEIAEDLDASDVLDCEIGFHNSADSAVVIEDLDRA